MFLCHDVLGLFGLFGVFGVFGVLRCVSASEAVVFLENLGLPRVCG